MKGFGIIFVLIAMIVSAYFILGPRDQGPNAPTAQNAMHIEQKAQRAVSLENMEAVARGLRAFQAEKGNWPASLKEAEEAGFIDHVPAGLVYDPGSGTVRLP